MNFHPSARPRHLVLIFGDQLDANSVAFDGFEPALDAVWMAEAAEESTHVWSHQAHIALFLSAMRHFREALRSRGFIVHYRALDDCLRATIRQTLDYGYAHHIQRLMVTRLFAQLLGVKPKSVHEWYLAMYVDAVEWVELPNTLGMSQHGDGGLMASKPYVATGKYIQRMAMQLKNLVRLTEASRLATREQSRKIRDQCLSQ